MKWNFFSIFIDYKLASELIDVMIKVFMFKLTKFNENLFKLIERKLATKLWFMGADSLCGIGNIFVTDSLIEGMKVSKHKQEKNKERWISILGAIFQMPNIFLSHRFNNHRNYSIFECKKSSKTSKFRLFYLEICLMLDHHRDECRGDNRDKSIVISIKGVLNNKLFITLFKSTSIFIHVLLNGLFSILFLCISAL